MAQIVYQPFSKKELGIPDAAFWRSALLGRDPTWQNRERRS